MAAGVSTFLPVEKPPVEGRGHPWPPPRGQERWTHPWDRPCLPPQLPQPPWASRSSPVKWAESCLPLHGVMRGAGREGGSWGKGFGPAVGLELGPHTSPPMTNCCGPHERQAGWSLRPRAGPPVPCPEPSPYSHLPPQSLGVPSGGRRHLPATQNLPEASVASSWGAGPSPGQVWSSPGLTSVCRVCGCPGVLTASPQPPAKGRGAEMGAGGAWGLGLGAALGPGLEAPLASSVRESRRAVAFGGGAAAPCPASRGSPSAWKGLIPSPFLSKRPPCLPSHLSGSGSQPHGQARTGPRCGLGTQSCL